MRFSADWFTLGASMFYVGALLLELPLVHYYPLNGRWSLTLLGPDEGTVMHWYGLTLAALLGGLISAFVLPEQWLPRRVRDHISAIPLLAMVACALILTQ